VPQKLRVVTNHIHLLEYHNTKLHAWIQQLTSEDIALQKKVEIVEETIQDDLKRLKDLLVAVDHSFTLWNHLQTPQN
jgi:hypothetical protein